MKTSVWTTASASTQLGVNTPVRWRLYLAVLLLNLIAFVCGTIYGWSAVVLPLLQAENSPVGIPPITDSEASWLASVYTLSRPLTIPFYKYCNDRYGRKVTGYIVVAPLIMGFLMLLFATSVEMLLWARITVGIATGGSFIFVPSYTIDAAEDDIKGKLGVFFGLSMDLGMCFCYTMVYFTSYRTLHICCTALSFASLFVIWWLPESPLFLMTIGKIEEAKNSLKWFRNGQETELEVERMKTRAEEVLEMREKKISFAELTKTSTLRGFLICTGLIANKSFNGFGPISSYTVQIFRDAGSTLSPNIATILLGLIEIVGCLVSCVSVEKCGRRFILITSNIAMGLCLIVLGAHFYLQSQGWNMEAVGLIPVITLSIFVFSNGAGLGPIPFVIPSEIVHSHYLGVVQSSNTIVQSLLFFATTLGFTPLAYVIGQYGCFWLFALCCAVSAVCIFLTLPETKNRSIEEILEQLEDKNFICSVLQHRKKANRHTLATSKKFVKSSETDSENNKY